MIIVSEAIDVGFSYGFESVKMRLQRVTDNVK